MMSQRYQWLLVVLFILAGCSDETLYNELNEREANQIVMVLRSEGLNPSKEEEKAVIRVVIPAEEFQKAMVVLEELGLPRRRNTNPDYLNSEDNNALVNSAKYTDYINTQIEEAIYDMPNVISVHVVSFIPESYIGREGGEANVSIAIVYGGDLDVQQVLPKIETFVSHAIPSLLPDHVSVQFFQKE